MSETSPIVFYDQHTAHQLLDIQESTLGLEILSDEEQMVIHLLEQQITSQYCTHVTVEGPPIYLWDNDQVESCDWQNPGFQQGWRLTNTVISELRRRCPGVVVQQYQMVDDKNYRPEEIPPVVSYEDQFDRDYAEAEDWRRFHTQVAEHIPVPALLYPHAGYMESGFERRDEENTCSKLDSRFQEEKIQEVRDQGGVGMHIVIHPQDFQRQQSAMLGNLKGLLAKDPRFEHLRGQEIKRLKMELSQEICRSYRHVWVDMGGNFAGFTAPYEQDGRFLFEELAIDVSEHVNH